MKRQRETSMSLLSIRNLTVSFATRSGAFTAVEAFDLSIERDEVVAIVGESGSGKSRRHARRHGALALDRHRDGGRASFRRSRPPDARAARAPRHHRTRHDHDLPGADVVAQPLLHRRLPAFRSAEGASRHRQGGAARALHRAPRRGRHHRSGAAPLGLSPSALGWHEPARDDRHGARLPAEAPDRRRADDGARRHHPGSDPRPVAAPQE